jgi:hypothetical protein
MSQEEHEKIVKRLPNHPLIKISEQDHHPLKQLAIEELERRAQESK